METKAWEKEGLTRKEYDLIKDKLGRDPNPVELAMFGVMWSEHCSYKNSLPLLKQLPSRGKRVRQGPGENAGIINAFDDINLVFKVESHNHPSAINPYQGAATGVGGIIRDVLSMGAQPKMTMAALCLGSPDKKRVNELLKNALNGARDYARDAGVPNEGISVKFSQPYEQNPLVNAMCMGVVKDENILTSSVTAAGREVILAGAPTGRDGIGGASFASENLSEQEDEAEDPVPDGVPYLERKLIAACRELVKSGTIYALQDLGAAGITGAASEMAAGGEKGMEIYLDRVPLAEKNMSSSEILLSETQERMLMTADEMKVEEVKEAFHSRGLEAEVIGRTTETGMLNIYHQNETAVGIPAALLVDGHPVHKRKSQKPSFAESVLEKQPDSLDSSYSSWKKPLLDLLSSPEFYFKNFSTGQNSYLEAGMCVHHLEEDKSALAALDSNGRRCQYQPRQGSEMLVAELARKIVCAGGRPLAVSDGLNMGNPLKPEVYWQLEECIAGLSEACRSFNLPIVGGNVSLFNEGPEGAIHPTPVVAMLGIIENSEQIIPACFIEEEKPIFLLGETRAELGMSDYFRIASGRNEGSLPALNLNEEAQLHKFMHEAHSRKLICSARSLSGGGLGAAVALSCLGGSTGACIELETSLSAEEFLFSETTGRVLIAGEKGREDELQELAEAKDMPICKLGITGGNKLKFDNLFKIHMKELKSAWKSAEKSLLLG